jgi:predicted RNase H-like HicB family nuclease
VIYEKGPTSWGAYVPDLPGVISVGDSRDEAERLIAEAIQFHLEGMRDEGLEIPPPSSSIETHPI